MTTILTAVAGGVGVLLAGNLPWAAVLAPLNLRFGSAVPWAVLPMAGYLWVYWRYIGGRLGAPETAGVRRDRLRAHPLRAEVWWLALVTGAAGFGAVFALLAVLVRLVPMPPTDALQLPAGMPAATAFTLLAMASLVAGVTEEAGFRGYMQGPIERRYGLAAGVLVNGVMFGLLHFPNHPGAVATMLPYYVAVSAVYGGLTWGANSILPALAIHAGGNVWSLTRLWITGRPEWQLSDVPPSLVWATGVDGPFAVALIVLAATTALAAVLCRSLRRASGPAGEPIGGA